MESDRHNTDVSSVRSSYTAFVSVCVYKMSVCLLPSALDGVYVALKKCRGATKDKQLIGLNRECAVVTDM